MERLTNNASTTLSASVNNSSDPVTFSVVSAALFPTSGNFTVLIDSEILLVTSVSGANFTASRAQEGTSIASHSSGATVTLILTAGSLSRYAKENAWSPYPRFTVTGVDDEFDDNSFTGWTLVGTTPTPTTVESNDKLSILHPGGDAAARLYSWMKSASLSNGDYVEVCFRSVYRDDNFPIFGVIVADGATYGAGNQVVAYFSSTEQKAYIASWTNYNTLGSFNDYSMRAIGWASCLIIRLTMTASNTWKLQLSPDGVQYVDVHTGFSRTLTPSHVGFTVSKWGGSLQSVWSVEYFRKGS